MTAKDALEVSFYGKAMKGLSTHQFTKEQSSEFIQEASQTLYEHIIEIVDSKVKLTVSEFHPTKSEVKEIVEKIRAELRQKLKVFFGQEEI